MPRAALAARRRPRSAAPTARRACATTSPRWRSSCSALVELVPDELREQVYEILRQILLLLRALIDWLVERLPQVRGADLVVEDIPVA